MTTLTASPHPPADGERFFSEISKAARSKDQLISSQLNRHISESATESAECVDPIEEHDRYKIALYYCYFLLGTTFEKHLIFQKDLCQRLQLNGRIRVSPEGINGVLSGLETHLREYETQLEQELAALATTTTFATLERTWELDIKYCALRPDLPVKSQLFDSCSIKATQHVVSLLDIDEKDDPKASKKKLGYSAGRQERRRQERHSEHSQWQQQALQIYERSLAETALPSTISCGIEDMYPSSEQNTLGPRHLSPAQWNQLLTDLGRESQQLPLEPRNVILLDCRNVYESNVGYFAAPHAVTLLTNTRKFSELPMILLQQADRIANCSHVFMYCTGGVRCERASLFLYTMLQERWRSSTTTDLEDDEDCSVRAKIPRIYQLHGGIQRYLESDDPLYYRGKNFVFDPRRTDPLQTNEIVGTCLVCQKPHDDYDNGHSPAENMESRCCKCRILVLVCNACRPTVYCDGDQVADSDVGESKRALYCGGFGLGCLHMPPVREISSPVSKTSPGEGAL